MKDIKLEKYLNSNHSGYKKDLAQIRAMLMHDEVVFYYLGTQFKISKSEFDNMDPLYSIIKTPDYLLNQMNVRRFGPTCITLFTYDMLGNKTVGKIKYEEIKFVKEEA